MLQYFIVEFLNGQTHLELFRERIFVEYYIRVRNGQSELVSQGMNSHSIDEYLMSPEIDVRPVKF